MMGLGGGAAIDIERDAKLLERVLDHLMVAVYHILWGDTLLACPHRDGHTMLITATDKQYVLLLQSQISYINISWYIHTCQMTDMHTAISVWQCRGHRCPLEFLFCHSFLINLIWLQSY